MVEMLEESDGDTDWICGNLGDECSGSHPAAREM